MRAPHLSNFHSIGSRLALGLTLAIAPVTHAADLSVSEKGDDKNTGISAQQPLLTLQKADSRVKPGDTVWIMAGTYRNLSKDQGGGSSSLLTVTHSGTPAAWITWRSYQNDRPELMAVGCWSAIDLKALLRRVRWSHAHRKQRQRASHRR